MNAIFPMPWAQFAALCWSILAVAFVICIIVIGWTA